MLVTNKGKVIRIPIAGIRIAGRNTQGVTLFNIDEDEQLVSVARLAGAAEATGDEADGDAADEDDAGDDEGGDQADAQPGGGEG
jgi:DNA gyrase subunit A